MFDVVLGADDLIEGLARGAVIPLSVRGEAVELRAGVPKDERISHLFFDLLELLREGVGAFPKAVLVLRHKSVGGEFVTKVFRLRLVWINNTASVRLFSFSQPCTNNTQGALVRE